MTKWCLAAAMTLSLALPLAAVAQTTGGTSVSASGKDDASGSTNKGSMSLANNPGGSTGTTVPTGGGGASGAGAPASGSTASGKDDVSGSTDKGATTSTTGNPGGTAGTTTSP